MSKCLAAVSFIGTLTCGFVMTLGLTIASRASSFVGYLVSAVGSLLILVMLCSTEDIWKNNDLLHRVMRFFWGISIFTAAMTVGLACLYHVTLNRPLFDVADQNWEKLSALDFTQKATALVLTSFLTASPIALSFFSKKFISEDE